MKIFLKPLMQMDELQKKLEYSRLLDNSDNYNILQNTHRDCFTIYKQGDTFYVDNAYSDETLELEAGISTYSIPIDEFHLYFNLDHIKEAKLSRQQSNEINAEAQELLNYSKETNPNKVMNALIQDHMGPLLKIITNKPNYESIWWKNYCKFVGLWATNLALVAIKFCDGAMWTLGANQGKSYNNNDKDGWQPAILAGTYTAFYVGIMNIFTTKAQEKLSSWALGEPVKSTAMELFRESLLLFTAIFTISSLWQVADNATSHFPKGLAWMGPFAICGAVFSLMYSGGHLLFNGFKNIKNTLLNVDDFKLNFAIACATGLFHYAVEGDPLSSMGTTCLGWVGSQIGCLLAVDFWSSMRKKATQQTIKDLGKEMFFAMESESNKTLVYEQVTKEMEEDNNLLFAS